MQRQLNCARVSEALGADPRLAPSEVHPSADEHLRRGEVARLKAEIEDLRRRNEALQERIDRLES